MEEANQHSYSKKRKEPCALENPFRGIFTRSRSQIYLHCNRSGRSRADSFLHGTQYSDLFRLLTLSKKPRRVSCSSFKDLRTSGVLCPAQENEDAKVFEEDIEELGDGFSRSAVDLQPRTPDSALFDKDASIGKVIDDLLTFEGIGEVETERPENMEDGETATPPDAEFLSNKLEFVSQDKNNSQNDARIEEGFGGADDRQNGSNLPGKSVLTPCFPGKLFKTPGSFSYRRLLPYLMDISEDKYCVKKIDQSANIESSLERKLVQLVSTSQSQGTKVKSTTENSPREDCADDLQGNNLKSISFEYITASSIPSDSTNDLSERDKTSGNAGRDQINSGAPCEIRVSYNSSIDIPTALNSTNLEECEVISAKSDHNKLMENQKTEQHDYYFACKTQNLNQADVNRSSRDRDVGDYFDDQKQSEEARIMKKCKAHHDCRAQNQCHLLCNAQGDDKLRGDSDYYVLGQIEGSNKECLQTTPPDDDIFLQTESCNHNFGSPLTRTIRRKYGSVHGSRINSSSKRKVQMKMFEIRSSFSYRRLLPFLTNIIEDESGACRDGIKAEKILKQKSLPTFSASNSDKITVKGFNDASIIQIPGLSDAICSSINHQPALSFPEKVVKSSITVDSQGEQKLQVEDTTSIANKKLETVSSKADVAHGCGIPSIKRCSVSTEESISKNAINVVLNQSSLSSEIGNRKCITKYTSAGKRVKFSSISQNFLQIGARVPLGVPSPSPPFKKGILKRNPRGCKGICTCLSCAAFRLHARKAFEFSRNQMQDAEELALDLIRELTQLRKVLEKSASNTDSSSAASANQVNEACRKASEVEKLAMNRISQMNYELNIHCRIPCEKRPRVRFANQVEEKSFVKSDSEQ